MKYKDLQHNPRQFNALCGMTLEQFKVLFQTFLIVCKEYFSKYSFAGKRRKREKSFRKDSTFSCYEDMLLFILIFLKNNPLQSHHAAMYNIDQPEANRMIHVTTDLLQKTLKKLGKTPSRSRTKMRDILSHNKTFFIDGTERPVQRSVDYKIQRQHFSGKKNDILLKTI